MIVQVLFIALSFVATSACFRQSTYQLETIDAYKYYLPQRLKSLITYVNQHGIDTASEWILHDDNLDSHLFIIEADKPYTLRAYSRNKQLFNKTAVQLQKELDPEMLENINVQRIFDQLVSTAKKCDTYVPYPWRLNKKDTTRYQVAYVHECSINGTVYILGATLFVQYVPVAFIVKHRAQTVAKRLQKEGLEDSLPLLAHDPDPDMYFFILQRRYPQRTILDGSSDEINLKTPEEIQALLYPVCVQSELCDLTYKYSRMEKIADSGGGFYVDIVPSAGKLVAKISYAQPMVYKKDLYILGTGISFINVPQEKRESSIQEVNEVLELVKKIGLKNTISIVHKKNEEGAAIFIDELEPPYSFIVNVNRAVEGKTAYAFRTYTTQRCKEHDYPDPYQVAIEVADFAKNGGGFHAYVALTKIDDNRYAPRLKISYIKACTHDGRDYSVGSGFIVG